MKHHHPSFAALPRKEAPHDDKRATILHACFVTGSAFGLNYVWENMQCPWFFIHRGGDTGQIAMVFAALGDVAMTWVAQSLVAIVSRRWLWLLGPWHWRQWATLLAAAVGLSVLVESWALATSAWAYTAINPRVPGTPISVLPVAQLLLLFPATFWLSRKLIRWASGPGAIAGTKRTPRGKEIKACRQEPQRTGEGETPRVHGSDMISMIHSDHPAGKSDATGNKP